MSKIETVKVADENFEGGFRVISAEDFDPDKHAIFGSQPPAGGEKALEDMTKAELLDKAGSLGLEAVKATMNKAEIVAAIQEAMASGSQPPAGGGE